MDYKTSKEMVKQNERAIAIFTRGARFHMDALGNGETGNWVVGRARLEQVDRVIIYLRDEQTGRNRLFLGNYAGYHQSPEPKRQVIRFSGLKEVGTTSSNWWQFSGSRHHPVAYVGEFSYPK